MEKEKKEEKIWFTNTRCPQCKSRLSMDRENIFCPRCDVSWNRSLLGKPNQFARKVSRRRK